MQLSCARIPRYILHRWGCCLRSYSSTITVSSYTMISIPLKSNLEIIALLRIGKSEWNTICSNFGGVVNLTIIDTLASDKVFFVLISVYLVITIGLMCAIFTNNVELLKMCLLLGLSVVIVAMINILIAMHIQKN